MQPVLEQLSFNDTPSVFIVIKAPEPVMTYRSEFKVYDLSDLAGDAGGMVGMLLGMSILALYDSLLAWMVKHVRSRKALF